MSIKLYDIAEVTEILKVHRRTVYNYVKDGQLKATKNGQVSKSKGRRSARLHFQRHKADHL